MKRVLLTKLSERPRKVYYDLQGLIKLDLVLFLRQNFIYKSSLSLKSLQYLKKPNLQ